VLTTQTYVLAFAVIALVTGVGLVLIARSLPRSWPGYVRGGLLGLVAALLLTPALPSEDASTLAPALVVVVFNTLFGDGWVSAVPAVARLLVALLVGALSGAVVASLRARFLSKE
jgi:hypothetical protein